MREIIFRFNTQVPLPIVIDSTEAPVIEEALQLIGGKAIINSINLEDGEERIAQGRSALQEVRRGGHRPDDRRKGDGEDGRARSSPLPAGSTTSSWDSTGCDRTT